MKKLILAMTIVLGMIACTKEEANPVHTSSTDTVLVSTSDTVLMSNTDTVFLASGTDTNYTFVVVDTIVSVTDTIGGELTDSANANYVAHFLYVPYNNLSEDDSINIKLSLPSFDINVDTTFSSPTPVEFKIFVKSEAKETLIHYHFEGVFGGSEHTTSGKNFSLVNGQSLFLRRGQSADTQTANLE